MSHNPPLGEVRVPLERRRFSRLGVLTLTFRLKDNGKVFAVSDVSVRGMGIRTLEEEDFIFFPVGKKIEGILKLGDEKIGILSHVRNIRGSRIGLEFETASLETFLDPKTLAKDLRVQPAPGRAAVWFHAPIGVDVVFYRSEEGFVRQMILQLLGSFVQWDQDLGLSTGNVQAADERMEIQGTVRLETLLLERDLSLDTSKLDIAKKLLLSSNIPQDLKVWALDTLSRK